MVGYVDDRVVPLRRLALMAPCPFPRPISIGSRAVRCVEQEVLGFISRRRGGAERPDASALMMDETAGRTTAMISGLAVRVIGRRDRRHWRAQSSGPAQAGIRDA